MSSEILATAGAVRIVITGEGENFSTVVAEANKQIAKLQGGANAAGKEMKKQFAEGRGAIMVLGEEIGVHLPRHVQKFVAQLPGVASAMSAAFDTIAVVAIGVAIFEAAKKLSEFVEKNREAARLNAEAWTESRNKLNESNDELDLTNLKLENQIAKLQHKPENKLAEALLEARVEAEKLDDKLQAAIKDAGDLLKKQSAGVFTQFLAGQAGTDYEQGMLREHGKWLGLAETPQQKLTESQSFGASLQTRMAELQALQGGKRTYTDASGQVRQTQVTFQAPNQSYKPEIASVQEMMRRQQLEEHSIRSSMTNASDEGQLSKLQGDKDQQAEEDKAAQRRLRSFETQLARQKRLWNMSVGDENAFWASKLSSFTLGSQQYLAVLDKFNAASAALSAQFATVLKKAAPQNIPDNVARADETLNQLLKEQAEDVRHIGERWAQFNRELGKGYAEAGAAAVKMQELKVSIALATGVINAHQAALKNAATHTEAYRLQMAALQDQLARIKGDSSLTNVERSTQSLQVQNQISALRGQGDLQKLQDQRAIDSSEALERLRNSAMRMADALTDLPAHISELFAHTVSDLNSKIVEAMSGKKNVDFAGVGRSALQGVERTGLEYTEGTLLKGVGKLGTKGNPMYTKSVDSPSQGARGASSGILGMLNNSNWAGQLFGGKLFGPGGVLGPAASAAGGAAMHGAGSVIGSLISGLTGFASGGPIPSNMPSIVGENGPEIFMPRSSGHIVPNDKAFSGGDTHLYVDARGSADPAMVQAAVERGMRQIRAEIPMRVVHAVRDHNSRSPKSGRL